MDVHLHDLVSIARHRAANTPNQLVYRFLSEHADQAKELTFAELDRQAQQIAALLQAHSLSTGSRVLLLFSPGLEYIVAFWGCLYAGAVAVPVYPPRKTRSQRFAQRFQQILQDAEATVALTTSTLAPLIASPVPGSSQQAQPFLLLTTDTLPASLVWQEQSFSGSQLAFLQYTSGTTSEPRGVMLTHENVVSNLASIYRAFGLSPESRGVIWLPPYHDMGLIGGILEPLYGGFPVTLMAPTTFLQKPVRWLEAISQTQATNSGGPNFAYDLCTQRISDEQKARLDLSHWKLAFNGAEPVRPSTMEQFSRAFASCGFRFQAFYPCYGLAEATLLVSGKLIAEASSMRQVDARALENHAVLSPAVGEQHDVRELVACGQVDDEQTLLIVDPVTCQPLPDLQVGEVWLQGPGIAKGYWKRPDLTATTFQAQVNDGRTIQQPFLRTGDLGFLDEGQLYVTGRLKDLIIIRGRNYYPQDIEMTAGRCHESLEVGNGAAFALTQDGEERLVVVHEVVRTQRHGPLDEVIYALKRAIAEEHGIAPYAVVLIRNGSLPRTTSGKIQRNLCRTQYLQRLLQVLREETVEEGLESAPVINRVQLLQAPGEQRPALLADALRAQVAHLIQAPVIDEHRQIPLTALGLDSMQCVALTAQIFRDFQITIELDALLDGMSLDQLFQSVSSQLEHEGENWNEEEEHGASSSEYEQQLSYGQQALWLTQRATAQNYAYTLRRVFAINHPIEIDLFRQALLLLTRRHESLATIFPTYEGKPFRHKLSFTEDTLPLVVVDGTAWSSEQTRAYRDTCLSTLFDLEQGPLFQVTLLCTAPDRFLLFFAIHHLLIDGWSLPLLCEDLGTFYTNLLHQKTISSAEVQARYTDFVQRQSEHLSSTRGIQSARYWREQFSELPEALQLPGTRQRFSSTFQTGEAGTERLHIDADLTRQMKRLCQQEQVTLSTFLATAFALLLARLSGQDDLCLSVPYAGRNQAAYGDLVGYCVNMLPVRIKLAGCPSFLSLLRHTHQAMMSALSHQAYPFSLVLRDLRVTHGKNLPSLDQVSFVMQSSASPRAHMLAPLLLGDAGEAIAFGALVLEPLRCDARSAQRDLSLAAAEDATGIRLALEYDRGLFEPETVQRLMVNLLTLVRESASQPQLGIYDIQYIDTQELALLHHWNRLPSDLISGNMLCLHHIFSAQAYLGPDAPALIFENESLTYGQLEQRTNRIAHFLQEQGIGPDVLVGLYMERSFELIIGLLAILKAGGAYVPLDPDSPAERLAFMMHDAHLSLILTQEALADHLPAAYRGKEVCLDSEQAQTRLLDYPTTLPGGPVRTNHLAYVIYTSGSTGKPKGVAVSHENVIRLLTRTQSWAHFTSQDVWVLFHSFAFDFSVWEIWGALTYGGCLVIPSYWVTRSPRDFVHLVSSQKVTVLNQTPSAFQQFMEYEARTDLALDLRLIIFGGEWLQAGLLQPWFARHGDRLPQLVNMYGITETTVHVTKHFIRESEARSIIGRPLEDLQVYLCDKHMHLVPIGLPGEIYVGGPGLARQYLYRPELTAERFVPHPWSQEPGARLYRSGDMARYLPDGSLEYLGRRDLQVKLRGFRIELEEIATVLAEHTALNECVVMLQTGLSGSQELTAYCTLASGQEQPSPATLRAFLQQSLPAYMLPTSFLFLEAFPLTQNGKLDQRALPVPAHQLSIRQEQDFIAPATYEETMMTAIWQEVLGRETIGVNDNFFEMGGDSIRAIQIVSRARSIGLSSSVQYLFLYPCVRDLVAQTLANPVISLTEHRPEPFSLLTDTDRTALLKDSQTNKLEDAYPATTLQAGLIYQSQFHETYERYVTSLNIAIPFEHALFEQALAALIERHEMLRTFFDLTHYSETIQCVARDAIPALHVVDLRALTDKEQEQTITDWIEAEKKQIVLWETLPLVHFVVHLRQSDCIQLTLIEPFLDGWSVSSLLTELLSDYNHLLQQRALPARQRLRSAFASYVLAEQQQLRSEASLDFWKKTLANAPFASLPAWQSEILVAQPRPAPHIERYHVAITPEISDALKQIGTRYRVPLKSLLLGAHLKVMGMLSGLSEVNTGVLFNVRMEEDDGERVPGLFLNALPMRVDIAHSSWLELAGKAYQSEQAMLAYRRYPIGALQQRLGVPHFFETVFNFTHFHSYRPLEHLPEIQVVQSYASEQTFFPLTIQCNLDHQTSHLRMALDYDVARLPLPQIEAIAGYYQRALQMIVNQPEGEARNEQLFAPVESEQLLHLWSHTPPQADAPADLFALFARQVEQTPGALALACGNVELTYRELAHQVESLAAILHQKKIGPDQPVGLYMERTPEMIVALLSIIRAGAAYVALDPAYPVERLSFMAQDARVSLIITQEHLSRRLPTNMCDTILLHSHQIQSTELPGLSPRWTPASSDNLAYITYTSGSTGVPKGVMVTRGNVVAFIQWALTAFSPEQLRYVLASTSLCFDLSVFEIFAPLCSGGTVVLAKDGLHMLEVAALYPLTLINTAPSVLHELLREHVLPESIQVVNMTAEALPRALAITLHQQPHELKVYDLYGPSEATVYSTYALIPPALCLEPAIGNPITGTYVYVLDQDMQPLPAGVPGELYIGGLGLGRGYHQRTDTTAQRFVPNPFNDAPGSRLYRTGDLVRYRVDGQIEFLERLDLQVKIRGFRIELGEIEMVLTEHEAVQIAVVIVREDIPDDKRLVAYVILAPEKTTQPEELRDFLRLHLPPQMLPNIFVIRESLPLTLNGKIDRRALAAQPLQIDQQRVNFVPPATPLEETIAQIWAEVLQIPQVGRNDNFFSLGGHSLLATQVVARLRAALAVELTMAEFFQPPTLTALATLLEQRQMLQQDDTFFNLLEQVEQLSDEEVAHLLVEKGIHSENGARIPHE